MVPCFRTGHLLFFLYSIQIPGEVAILSTVELQYIMKDLIMQLTFDLFTTNDLSKNKTSRVISMKSKLTLFQSQ